MQGRTSPFVTSGPPLDFSFKELKNCAEIELDEYRVGRRHSVTEKTLLEGIGNEFACSPGNTSGGNLGASAQATQLVQPSRCVVRRVTTSVKLNNNMLETVSGLPDVLGIAIGSPLMSIQWLDLSFNQLVTVEPELLRFLNLKALYLHGNCFKSMSAVERLKKLPKLLSLTLNGNPIECGKNYRRHVIGILPQLRSLDHSTITEDELHSSAAWYKGHLQRSAERKERQRDLMSPDM